MDLIQIVTLALVQGITEFLPISSSAHLILASHLGAWRDQGLAFDMALHLGSLLAVLAYFRVELKDIVLASMKSLAAGQINAHARLLINLCVATLPIGILGLGLRSWVENNLRTDTVIALATILFGILLWFGDRSAHRIRPEDQRSELDLNWRDALWIGLAQALAMIPGTSRSGITITAALFLGLSRQGSARFSFLLSIPAILGAGLVGFADAATEFSTQTSNLSFSDFGIGVLLSALSAFVCIHFFIMLLEKTGMTPYVVYRLILGAVLLYLGMN